MLANNTIQQWKNSGVRVEDGINALLKHPEVTKVLPSMLFFSIFYFINLFFFISPILLI